MKKKKKKKKKKGGWGVHTELIWRLIPRRQQKKKKKIKKNMNRDWLAIAALLIKMC